MSRIRAQHVLLASLAYLTIAWALFFIVDVYRIGGIAEWIGKRGVQQPTTWMHLFQEGGPTEMLQWLALGAASVIAAVIAGMHRHSIHDRERRAAGFWFVMSVALTLMLIEDAGNPRHMVRSWAEMIGGDVIYNRIAEFSFYALLASVPLYAAVRYGRTMWTYRRTRWWLAGGFIGYGVAAGASAMRDWWYTKAGAAFERLLGAELDRIYEGQGPTEFWLMDFLIEESVELVAATLLLGAAIAFLHEARRVGGDGRDGLPQG